MKYAATLTKVLCQSNVRSKTILLNLCLFTSEAWVVSPGLPDELDRALQNQLGAEPAAWPALHINIDMVSYGDHSHLEQTETICMAVLCHMNNNSIPSVTTGRRKNTF